MLKPRLLGSLILGYILFYKLWELTLILSGVRPGGRGDSESDLAIIGYVLLALFALILLSYASGSVGLFLRKKWSASVVFYAAIGEATTLLLAGTMFTYFTVGRSVASLTPLDILPFLLLLIFPVGLGYAARSLRRNPELWESPQKDSGDKAGPSAHIQGDWIGPALRRKIFWAVLGTGLLLPVALALIVAINSLIQKEPIAISGAILFIFLLDATLFALPYVVLAFIVRAVIRVDSNEGLYRPVRRLFVLAGILVGMTAVIAPTLYASFVDAEIAAVLIYAPYWPFMVALPGVVVGAVLGLMAYGVRGVYWRLRGSSKAEG
jgi:hypothetical protein